VSRASLLLLLAGISLSCGSERRAERARGQNAALGGEIAARVGGEPIALRTVGSVADAQGITAQEAAWRLVDDAVAAFAARAEGRDRRAPTSWLLISRRARFAADALAVVTSRRWRDDDRPPSVRVMHAIVLRPKADSLLDDARAVATELQEALAHASNDDFEAKAKAVSHDPKLELRVERLPAMTEDGRVVEADGAMAKAASARPSAGATSGVVETRFGFHVIRLLERLPEQRTPVEVRRTKYADEVYSQRAREQMNARLSALRASNPVVVESAAEQLMRSVKISRDAAGAP
jgi:peptidyl-prolyl cis-trans isomerase C